MYDFDFGKLFLFLLIVGIVIGLSCQPVCNCVGKVVPVKVQWKGGA